MSALEEMAIFARVVEERSFTTAARSLGLSKATASKAVQRLETRLGVRLLNRTTRRFSITDVGAAFYENCARIVAEAERAEEAVTRLTATPKGRLKVTVPMSFGVPHVAPALAEFLERYPGIYVDLTMTDAFLDLIEDGFDLAIRIARLPDSSLVARKLAPCRFAICGSPHYFERRGVPGTPRELAHHTCLHYAHNASGDSWRLNGPNGTIAVRVGGPLRADNGEALRQAAVGGAGLILVPLFFVADDLRAGRLCAVLPDYTWETSVYAVYPSARQTSTKVQAFIEFFAERFGPDPYWERDLPLP